MKIPNGTRPTTDSLRTTLTVKMLVALTSPALAQNLSAQEEALVSSPLTSRVSVTAHRTPEAAPRKSNTPTETATRLMAGPPQTNHMVLPMVVTALSGTVNSRENLEATSTPRDSFPFKLPAPTPNLLSKSNSRNSTVDLMRKFCVPPAEPNPSLLAEEPLLSSAQIQELSAMPDSVTPENCVTKPVARMVDAKTTVTAEEED